MNKEDSFKEKFKQAILSTVKVISEDNFSNPKNLFDYSIKQNVVGDVEHKIIEEVSWHGPT